MQLTAFVKLNVWNPLIFLGADAVIEDDEGFVFPRPYPTMRQLAVGIGR